jgi:hypothetical protein
MGRSRNKSSILAAIAGCNARRLLRRSASTLGGPLQTANNAAVRQLWPAKMCDLFLDRPYACRASSVKQEESFHKRKAVREAYPPTFAMLVFAVATSARPCVRVYVNLTSAGMAGLAAPGTSVRLVIQGQGHGDGLAAVGEGAQVDTVFRVGKIAAPRYMHFMVAVRLSLFVDVVMLHCAPPAVLSMSPTVAC